MRTRRVYCMEVTGGCRPPSLTSSTRHGVWGARRRRQVLGFWAGEGGSVVGKSSGRWRQGMEVPGLAAVNKGGGAEVISVSCAAPGSCAAVGFYTDGSGHQQGFVVSRSNGRWRQAIEVPGLAALRKGPYARVQSVSCASAGSCSAGGVYPTHGGGPGQAVLVSERNRRCAAPPPAA